MFEPGSDVPSMCMPEDNRVNNYSAVKWIEMLCRETEAKIVVSSTWRMDDNYKECLYNGGLSREIEILGKTPRISNEIRGKEIQRWLEENSHLIIEKYVIIDDDSDMGHLLDRLVKCDFEWGFGLSGYRKAKEILTEGD